MTQTITVEDGTGVVDANAYEDVAATVTRLGDLGELAFVAAGDDTRAASLFRGTREAEGILDGHLTGGRTITAQGLNYPRTNSYLRRRVIGSTVIPENLKLVCALKAETWAARLSAAGKAEAPAGVKKLDVEGTKLEFFEDPKSGPRELEAERLIGEFMTRGRRLP